MKKRRSWPHKVPGISWNDCPLLTLHEDPRYLFDPGDSIRLQFSDSHKPMEKKEPENTLQKQFILLKFYGDKETTDRIWEEIQFCKQMHQLRPQQWELEFVKPRVLEKVIQN